MGIEDEWISKIIPKGIVAPIGDSKVSLKFRRGKKGCSEGPKLSSGSGIAAMSSVLRGWKVSLNTEGDGSSRAAGAGIWRRLRTVASIVATTARGLDK
ncbi:hypothetical protein CEXT_738371 [Caerostris extrusa]|uniref:Uncharacterized protein n=1 Tax=Caerostris extrusa TaxID=172846 RepID=A0AAV4VQF4_CAEEX|nr:hypothetical protein CEXT_738371 [Caerostris extrusa]